MSISLVPVSTVGIRRTGARLVQRGHWRYHRQRL